MTATRNKLSPLSSALESTSTGGGKACGHGEGDAHEGEGSELRCPCGSLLARYVDGKVELKCRRCKRTMWIAVTPEGELD